MRKNEISELSPDNKDLMKVLSRFMWKEDDFYPQCASFNAKGAAVSDRTKFIFIEGDAPYKGTFDINGNRILPENLFGNLNDFDIEILSKVDFKIKATLRSVKKSVHGMYPSNKKTFLTLLPMPSKLLATNKTVDIDSPDVLQISDFKDLNLVDYQYTGKAFPMRFSMREFNDILKIVGDIYDDSIRYDSSEPIELKFCFIGAYSRQQRALVITFPSIFGKTSILLMPIIIRSDEYSNMYGTIYIEQYEKMFKEYVANALMSFKSKLKKL